VGRGYPLGVMRLLPLLTSLVALPLAACSVLPRPASRPAVWPLRADTLAANGGERDCDLIHLELDLRLDWDAQRVSGSATSWIRALPGGCDGVRLHGVGLEVHEVEDSRGRALDWEFSSPNLDVTLAEHLAAGDELGIKVTYTTQAPAKGMVFVDADPSSAGFAPEIWTQGQFEDNRYWYPAWDLPNDRTTVDLSVRVGHDMRAIAGGELVGVEEHGSGERTFRWRLAQRIPTYLVALVAGRWETYEDRAGDVPLHYHVPPGTGEAAARAALGETPAMLAFFESLLDEPFPYTKYDQAIVSGFTWAGMENASITVLHDALLGGQEALLDLDGDPRLLVAHELAHQWFGDHVTCLDWSHLWLNEAWASYLELVWEREQAGAASFALWLERYREDYLARGDDCRLPLALDWQSQGVSRRRANHVYTKGPWVLHMLERELGEEAFWAATRAYLDDHGDGLVQTSDFARSVFDATGRNVQGFLEQWVELGGHPELELRFEPGETGTGEAYVDVIVRQTQTFDALVPLFRFDLDLELTQAGGERRERRLRVDGAEQSVRVPLTGELLDVTVDPRAELLAEFDLQKPIEMWLRQLARQDAPVLQWRALRPVAGAAREGLPEALTGLLRIAGEHPEPLLRERAVSYLALSDPRAARTLLRLLATDPAARVRRKAAAGLLLLMDGGRALDGDELALIQRRQQLEPSSATRALLEQLLDGRP
jgi:aminopeptidase N